jgi:hypothetical protein
MKVGYARTSTSDQKAGFDSDRETELHRPRHGSTAVFATLYGGAGGRMTDDRTRPGPRLTGEAFSRFA